MKKICFAILVHEKKEVVRDLVENTRYFCPNSSILLYNGGRDPDLCSGLPCMICPYSKPLEWGKLAEFMLDSMKWLHEVQHDYDYLVTMDSDCLFAKLGYEEFIQSEMERVDLMAVEARIAEAWWQPVVTLREEWENWRGLLHSEPLYGCFNPAQVFSRRLVERFLSFEKIDLIEKSVKETKAFALEETLFINWARSLGCKVKAYPNDVGRYIRYRQPQTQEEVNTYLKEGHKSYLLHPVTRDMKDGARAFVRSLLY